MLATCNLATTFCVLEIGAWNCGIVGATQFCQPVIRSMACTIKTARASLSYDHKLQS